MITNETISDKEYSPKQFITFIQKIIQANDGLFGLKSPEKNKLIMRKIANHVFYDFRVNGGIEVTFLKFLKFKEEQNTRFDINKKEKLIPFFQDLQKELFQKGIIPKKIFKLSKDVKDAEKVKSTILKLGAEITDGNSFTHLVEPDLITYNYTREGEYLRTIVHKKDKNLVHWWFYPSSFDEWISSKDLSEKVENTKKTQYKIVSLKKF